MKKALRFLPWIAVVLWMALIFSFSMENGSESSQSSGGFIRTFLETFRLGFTELAYEDQHAMIEVLDHFVRKAAHFTIFAVLGFLIRGALASTFPGVSRKKLFLSALLLGAVYAVSDEVHQYFVPGRACMIRDMLLDSAGVLTGCGIMEGLLALIRRYVAGRKKQN